MGGDAMRSFVAIAVIATALIGLNANASAQKRDLVVAAAQSDAGKLDPHQTSAGADKAILNWMFNALVRIRPGQANPEFVEPDLAESWTANETGTEWTFKLRSGVLCHDGTEFTAEDAAYSLKRSSDKATSAFAGDFNALARVEALDKNTLKITLKNRIPSLLGLVSNYHGGLLVCKAAAEAGLESFGRKPIGTGPFMFVEYQPQQFVKMTANKKYFRGAPQLDTITYRYIPSDATRDLAFRAGEVDMMFGRQNDQWVQRVREMPGAKVVAMEPAELNMLHLNMAMKPLDDIRVRQAIAYALDRKAMVQFSGPEVSREAVSVVPNGNLGINEKPGLVEPSVAKAKQLLAEAGYPNGVSVKSVQSTLPSLLRIMEAVQAQLRKAGINLELETVDHPTYHANIRKDLSGVTLYQAARFPVADVYLTQFFHSASTVGKTTAIVNFSHCAVADKEIEAARSESSVEKQKALWASAQEKTVKEVCGVPFSESLVMWAWRDTLDMGYEMKGSLNLGPHITEKTRFTK
jgi:peptide/nickel transport system substrate-binding protein